MQLADVLGRIFVGAPIEFRAYDGSRSGPPDADVGLELRTPRAVRHLVTAPGELGVARAVVAGDVELVGDAYTALRHLSRVTIGTLSWAERAELLRTLGPGSLRPTAAPAEEVRRQWRHGWRHSKARDAAAISHHYDVSNRFYEWVLGPSMTYTCAVYPRADATLAEAQFEKHDLVARKLGLEPGMRLLDVGCGWGGMVMHAAEHYGVRALGVTLSRQQAEWAQKTIAERGLADLAEVRHRDYRDVTETGFDAVSSIGLTEHVGARELPAYFRFLLGKLRPQGRLLNHCIMRPTNLQPLRVRRGFINRYVFPDGELMGLGRIASVMQDNGFEIRHEENLREHYALTLAAWSANLDQHWDEAVREVGPGKARVWRLYLAGCRLAFEQNKIQLHQLLGVKTQDGEAGMALRPTW